MSTREYPRILTAPPGPRAQAIIEREQPYASTSYIKEYPLVISHGSGAMVEDVDGNRFIDFMAGIAVASTGHAHPKVVEAIQSAAGRFLSMCGTDFYYQSMSELVERLAKIAPGPSPKRVFLANSGSEAVDGALKLVRNSTGRSAIIAFEGAFHGRTYGAMSLTSSKAKYRASFGPFVPGVHHVPFPDPYRLATNGQEPGDFVLDRIHDLFERQLAPTDVAAIFMEPMQGEGGYVVPPMDFMKKIRALCDEHGILLVADEIQAGVGRTGRMWASELFGVEPDVLLTAKGLGSGMPIAAIVARAEIMRWVAGSHGSTYGGNPIACSAALATLDLVENGLAENARVMGARLMEGLKVLQDKYEVIGDVRGHGLFIGVDFVKDRKTKAPARELVHALELEAFGRGLLLLPCGKSVVRVAPPLVLDAYDVDTGLEILDASLAKLTG